MTVSEFIFLAVGLVLGVASGAALVQIIRARPPSRREVRLTVSQDAIPRRRATTLADDAFVTVAPEPARGGPADRRAFDGETPPGTEERRTNVLSGRTNVPSGSQMVAETGSRVGRLANRIVGMPISPGADPMLGAIRASARAAATRDHGASASSGVPAPGAVAVLDPPSAAAPTAPPASAPSYTGPCADERRLADERCELASRAQERAVAAADILRRAKRAYEAHTQAATAAAEAANPLAVRSLKEGVQRDFRASSRAAGAPDAVEAAARTWLQEINRINREAASASLTADRERERAAAAGASLERLALEADAARIGAEMAGAACVAARTVVADCDERSAAGSVLSRAAPPTTAPVQQDGHDEALGIALEGGRQPRIFRLLRRDPEAMDRMVATLAGDDPDDARRWSLALAGFVDAIVVDAIEQAYLRFPDDHSFWGPYTIQQNRDITLALASLGHRFDGLAGWEDERQPTQRELSLALGYAGLDPMRVRGWPNEQQTADLFRDVEVAADEYLAGAAGDLTLSEMVELLGRRADNLVDLWNNWGRVRPLLLEEA